VKVLFVHNYYRSHQPSGENVAFDLEVELARQKGAQVEIFSRHSDELEQLGLRGKIKAAVSCIWSSESAKGFLATLLRFKPDVVHVHNTFPLVSPSVAWSASHAGFPVCMTLHNYRLACAAGIPIRNGKPCTECIDSQSVLPAIRHRCYRQSRAATLPIATGIAIHRALNTWQRSVDVFIALSNFQAAMLVRGGIPSNRIAVKPNCYPDPPTVVPWSNRKHHAVYLGRLSSEKGVDTLVQAWTGPSADQLPPLLIVGSGPEEGDLRKLAGNSTNIKFLGQLSFEEGQQVLAQAKLLVVPSRCFEGFPLVVREAFALAVPVLAADIGALAEIVRGDLAGKLFKPNSSVDLAQRALALFSDNGKLQGLSNAGYQEYRSRYTGEANYLQLTAIYKRAMESRRLKS
jgi:glycosyltransferase involved in cell wall biosynthesis